MPPLNLALTILESKKEKKKNCAGEKHHIQDIEKRKKNARGEKTAQKKKMRAQKCGLSFYFAAAIIRNTE